MPHTTTGTTSYVLIKYSRAYPTKRVVPATRLDSHNGSELASEWQHFTNPTIRLVLDVKSTTNGGIESVRLRILWQIDSEHDSGQKQQDVVFEDLDLLSFSSDMGFNTAHRMNSIEGLPLKAVYRDTVVGIRYFYSRESEVMPNYRRFQISFQSASEASEFIESIKPVCPCKMNPTPVQTLQNNITMQSHNVARLGKSAVPQHLLRPLSTQTDCLERTRNLTFVHPSSTYHQRALASSAKNTPTIDPPRPRSSTPSYTLSVSPLEVDRDGPMLAVSSSQPPVAAPLSMASIPAEHVHSQTHILPNSDQGMESNEVAKRFSQTHPANPASSLPASSFPNSSDDPTRNPIEPGTKSIYLERIDTHPILVTLTDSTSLYNLPTPTLERLVGDIIREDGFIHLVERLAKMFTIRRAANI